MEIISAQFIKGIIKPDVELENNFPQVAFIGRSNVGKSSLINSLVGQKKLARTSNTPGRTQQINLFLINGSNYFLDLPGYGYARTSKVTRLKLSDIINGYLFESLYQQKKVVMVIDAKVGVTNLDLEMLELLEKNFKDVLIVANKVDKLRPSNRKKQLDDMQKKIGEHKIIPYSSLKRVGRAELLREIL